MPSGCSYSSCPLSRCLFHVIAPRWDRHMITQRIPRTVG
jgi:hypothetical protein